MSASFSSSLHSHFSWTGNLRSEDIDLPIEELYGSASGLNSESPSLMVVPI